MHFLLFEDGFIKSYSDLVFDEISEVSLWKVVHCDPFLKNKKSQLPVSVS